MYEFNPMTSMELLQTTQFPCPPACDTINDDPERHVQQASSPTFSDLVRRVFQRISTRRHAA